MKLNKFIVLFLMLLPVMIKADELRLTFDSANAAYSKGNYEKAIELYEKILSSGRESSVLYYNLANAQLKKNNLGQAILNYERAKKLDPDDDDIIANLKLANQRTEDKIEAAPQLFLSQWQTGVTDLMTERSWSLLCISTLTFGLLFIIVYIISSDKRIKQIGFFAGFSLIILSVMTFFLAKSKYSDNIASSSAVIISGSVTVTGSPTETGTKLFILHEGTKVSITEKAEDWIEIRIPNGNVGWVKSSVLEEI